MTHRVYRRNVKDISTEEVMRWVFKQIDQNQSKDFTVQFKEEGNVVIIIMHDC